MGILMGAQDVKYLAIGSFVMLVVLCARHFRDLLGGFRRSAECHGGVPGAVGGVHPVVPGRAGVHLRPPRRLGCVD